MATDETAAPSTATPFIHPAPGRCVVRIVERILKIAGVDLDQRYEYQPMIGELIVLGDPTNAREEAICKWAMERSEFGDVFVFSQYGTGSPYWAKEMETMLTAGIDFRWLQGLRLFDIGQLGATISGAGQYGEMPARKEDVQ